MPSHESINGPSSIVQTETPDSELEATPPAAQDRLTIPEPETAPFLDILEAIRQRQIELYRINLKKLERIGPNTWQSSEKHARHRMQENHMRQVVRVIKKKIQATNVVLTELHSELINLPPHFNAADLATISYSGLHFLYYELLATRLPDDHPLAANVWGFKQVIGIALESREPEFKTLI